MAVGIVLEVNLILSLMTGVVPKWLKKKRKSFQKRALMQPCVAGARFHFCHFPSVSHIWACLIIGWNKREELIEEEGSVDGEALWLLLWVTWSFPEVVLVRSRHAIHRGVRETRRLRRHTHLPSTKPLLYGGRRQAHFTFCPATQQCSGSCGAMVQHHCLIHFLTFSNPNSHYCLIISKYSEDFARV